MFSHFRKKLENAFYPVLSFDYDDDADDDADKLDRF